jgi:hypothetical protein
MIPIRKVSDHHLTEIDNSSVAIYRAKIKKCHNFIFLWDHTTGFLWTHIKIMFLSVSFLVDPCKKVSFPLSIIIWQKLTIHQLRYTENAKKHYSSNMHRRRSRGIEYYDNSDLQKWWYMPSKRFGLEYHHIQVMPHTKMFLSVSFFSGPKIKKCHNFIFLWDHTTGFLWTHIKIMFLSV